ncbi:hypothetical protein TL16_g04584 [Triparma laevis f. inornata]|uniref:CREG-like beta-barrel domain-containing protein n=2 Tax=Triparma laevis TaxID=1534972 RepID=A0A9W7FIT2_9STRA|nr:hypothetical protein TL16_g04584 [Triparma laevis f. inornata]GMI12972.1 hypothetical protein TrLO_g11069 [Triparma laevis f. longispina]
MKLTAVLSTIFLGYTAASTCEDLPKKPLFTAEEETARWMAHVMDWGVLSTISTMNTTMAAPFGNPYSFVDGGCGSDKSTGSIYFYASGMDQSMVDIESNPSVSFALSEASLNGDDSIEQSACVLGPSGDPENPPCARAVFNGQLTKLENDSDEYNTIQAAFFERHASMADWPTDHSWFIGKVKLENIWLIDIYGGAKTLDLDTYFGVSL